MDGQREDIVRGLPWPAISQQIWDMKYRLKEPDGTPVDKTIEDTWRRVATALAAPEAEPEKWAPVFYEALDGFQFMPAGRVIAGAGTGRHVTLQNCFVMGTIPDSLDGIFSHLREAALTMQMGGGIGYDFSTLRPNGAFVSGVGTDASGPVSFMDCWDTMCRTIMSAGERRGAMMATLACDHPDIEQFIGAKKDPLRLRKFNLSVLVTDAFLRAVADDAAWQLQFGGKIYKTIQARELWDKIMRATYAYAEPGVIFIDRINASNNLYWCEKIRATNPCGEQPMPPYANCLLGSLNLAALIEDPFTAAPHMTDRLRGLVRTAVRILDNVIEISKFPLEEQRKEAFAKRRIGLGITGLADALIMCGLRYGSPAAVQATEFWLGEIECAAYLASAELAADKGTFQLYDREKYLAGEHIRGLPDEVKAAIADAGMRNSHTMSVAPTGTISLLGGNVSSGMEPIYSLPPYSRKLLMADGSHEEHEVADYAVALWRSLRDDEPLPDYFVDVSMLGPEDHLVMLAAAQKHTDAGISKTINLPENIPFNEFSGVYLRANALGCKSCTTYRPNEVTGSVLSVAPAVASVVEDRDGIVRLTAPLMAPDELPARRYKIRWPGSEHALYLLMSDMEEHGRMRPFEIFTVSNDTETDEWRTALTRMISSIYRRGGDVAFVAHELQQIYSKKGGAWLDGAYVPSLPAAIGLYIERHMRGIGFLPSVAAAEQPALVAAGGFVAAASTGMRQCPQCGRPALIHTEGCERCTQCDYSKC
ncbi:MAG TPA: adenosylcobalamin-dependent ribonucleoside-diphosphate reductase [Stellaceae bacterium]|nr:adenosylcobalamin-dependent ribonucleoside-diphosphate reductase [Stellaceae bacterium]